jgi:hypothetical protein
VYESAHGDQELGCHRDHWLGVAVQAAGAKDWQAGGGLDGIPGGGVQRVAMRPGDVLVVPRGLPHLVTTPAVPGRSVHLALSLYRDPLPGPAAPCQAVGEPRCAFGTGGQF